MKYSLIFSVAMAVLAVSACEKDGRGARCNAIRAARRHRIERIDQRTDQHCSGYAHRLQPSQRKAGNASRFTYRLAKQTEPTRKYEQSGRVDEHAEAGASRRPFNVSIAST